MASLHIISPVYYFGRSLISPIVEEENSTRHSSQPGDGVIFKVITPKSFGYPECKGASGSSWWGLGPWEPPILAHIKPSGSIQRLEASPLLD